jgi:hypothetical protein
MADRRSNFASPFSDRRSRANRRMRAFRVACAMDSSQLQGLIVGDGR